MKQRTVKYEKRHILFLVVLCIACMFFLCACQNKEMKKCVLQVFADTSLENKFPLVGEKFLVTDGKDYDIQYYFDSPQTLLEKIRSGEQCDFLITSSETLKDQLIKEGISTEEKTDNLLRSPMAMVTSNQHPSSPVSLDNLFYQTEINEEEEYYEEEIDGYRLYTDLLWEVTAEDQWQEEWDELYAGLWIREEIPSIGILSTVEKEGQCAKDLLNQDGQTFELLEQIGKIHTFDSISSLLDAVGNGDVQTGLCAFTNTFSEKNIKMLKVYENAGDPTVPYYASLIIGSDNRKEAKELMTFMQGDHARRFFEDFGFYFMR